MVAATAPSDHCVMSCRSCDGLVRSLTPFVLEGRGRGGPVKGHWDPLGLAEGCQAPPTPALVRHAVIDTKSFRRPFSRSTRPALPLIVLTSCHRRFSTVEKVKCQLNRATRSPMDSNLVHKMRTAPVFVAGRMGTKWKFPRSVRDWLISTKKSLKSNKKRSLILIVV